MRKTIQSLLLLLCFSLSYSLLFSQISYPTEILSLKDMNLRGNIRKVVDSAHFLNKKGKVDEEKQGIKKVYYFDEKGGINTLLEFATLKGKSYIVNRTKYEYVGNKLAKKIEEDSKGKKVFFYTYTKNGYYITQESNKDSIFIELENGMRKSLTRISYSARYIDGPKDSRYESVLSYLYNENGRIKTTKIGFTTGPQFEYNQSGDIVTYNDINDLIDDYSYKYEQNNWVECVIERRKFGYDALGLGTTVQLKIFRNISFYETNDNSSLSNTDNGMIDIAMTIKNYNSSYILLASYAGGKAAFVKDTIKSVGGVFRYQKKISDVAEAIYNVVLPPNNESFQLIIDNNNNHFNVQANANDIQKSIVFTNSNENKVFYLYNDCITAYNKKLELPNANRDKLQKEALAHMDELIAQNPNTYLAFWLKSQKPVTEVYIEDRKKQFFSIVNLEDDRLSSTSYFTQMIDGYLEKIMPQTVEGQLEGVDVIMQKCQKSKVNYKTLLFHLIAKYQTTSYVCWDAIYAHVAQKYYCINDNAINVDDKQKIILNNICEATKKLKPFLCGQILPDIKVSSIKNSKASFFALSSMVAKYKVIILWDLDKLNDKTPFKELEIIYPKLKNKNVELITVAKNNRNEAKIFDYTAKYNISWVNAIELGENMGKVYDMILPLHVFILDSNNKILYKQLAIDQIERAINNLNP